MEALKTALANLIKIKSLVTIAVISVFVTLSVKGTIAADNAMIIISMVVSFYFGTQAERKGGV